MEMFWKLVIFVLVLSFMVFVTFFGRIPALRQTPIGALHRTIWVHIPNSLMSIDQRYTGGRISGTLSSFGNKVMYDRHPTVVIFFLVIMVAGQALYLPPVWAELESVFVKLSIVIAVAMPYTFLYLACASDSGFITPETHSYHMSLYPYDHANFHPGNVCRTCNLLKPARSKHCSVCKRCVAKSDHHCVFINACVGYGNQHWFILLLASTAFMTSYGGTLGLAILSSAMRKIHPDFTLWPSRERGWEHFVLSWTAAMQRDVSLGATTLLAGLLSPMVWGLLIFTLYHVYRGITTNESLKWSDWQEDIADGLAFSRPLPRNRRKERTIEPLCSRWPVEPELILVATNDGQLPRSSGAPLPGEGEWQRVKSIRDVENMYDMGFWDNLVDVFIKDYAFGATKDGLPGNRYNRMKRS